MMERNLNNSSLGENELYKQYSDYESFSLENPDGTKEQIQHPVIVNEFDFIGRHHAIGDKEIVQCAIYESVHKECINFDVPFSEYLELIGISYDSYLAARRRDDGRSKPNRLMFDLHQNHVNKLDRDAKIVYEDMKQKEGFADRGQKFSKESDDRSFMDIFNQPDNLQKVGYMVSAPLSDDLLDMKVDLYFVLKRQLESQNKFPIVFGIQSTTTQPDSDIARRKRQYFTLDGIFKHASTHPEFGSVARVVLAVGPDFLKHEEVSIHRKLYDIAKRRVESSAGRTKFEKMKPEEIEHAIAEMIHDMPLSEVFSSPKKSGAEKIKEKRIFLLLEMRGELERYLRESVDMPSHDQKRIGIFMNGLDRALELLGVQVPKTTSMTSSTSSITERKETAGGTVLRRRKTVG